MESAKSALYFVRRFISKDSGLNAIIVHGRYLWQENVTRFTETALNVQEKKFIRLEITLPFVLNRWILAKKGTKSLVICGSTPLEKNTIILKFAKDGVEEQRMVEFMGTKTKQSFEIEPIYGVNDVSLVFLPGSNFNFTSICFCEA